MTTPTYRVDLFVPHDGRFAPITWTQDKPPDAVIRQGHESSPGTIALVIRIDGDGEHVCERWRVDERGRVLRARV